jgi:hypothetical protein
MGSKRFSVLLIAVVGTGVVGEVFGGSDVVRGGVWGGVVVVVQPAK